MLYSVPNAICLRQSVRFGPKSVTIVVNLANFGVKSDLPGPRNLPVVPLPPVVCGNTLRDVMYMTSFIEFESINVMVVCFRGVKFDIHIGSDWPQMGQFWDFLRSVSVHFARTCCMAKYDNPKLDRESRSNEMTSSQSNQKSPTEQKFIDNGGFRGRRRKVEGLVSYNL